MVYYEEKQYFRNKWVMLLLVFLLCVVLTGIYQQVILGKAFGTHPISDAGLIFVSLIPVALIFLMVFMHMKLRIGEKGLYFMIKPLNRKYHYYSWQEIEKVQVRKYNPISEYGGYGVRSWFGNTSLNISGNNGLQVYLKSGNTVLFGTQKPEEVKEVIEKLQKKGLVKIENIENKAGV